jgi:hypothetical protein
MQNINNRGQNFATTSGLLTATGAETVYDTTVTICYCVNGKALTKTAVTDGATPTTDGVSGSAFRTLTASQGTVLVWCLDGSGTVKVLEGSRESLDSAGNFKQVPQFPNIPDTLTPFAYQVLKASSSAGTITIGSSNWNATGFTNAIVNVMVLPDRPQVS